MSWEFISNTAQLEGFEEFFVCPHVREVLESPDYPNDRVMWLVDRETMRLAESGETDSMYGRWAFVWGAADKGWRPGRPWLPKDDGADNHALWAVIDEVRGVEESKRLGGIRLSASDVAKALVLALLPTALHGLTVTEWRDYGENIDFTLSNGQEFGFEVWQS